MIPTSKKTKFFLALLGLLLGIYLATTLKIGYLSDDYSLLQLSQEGKQLWGLHYSPIMGQLWQCSANGSFGPLGWHLLTLVFHTLNVVLVYLIAKQGCYLSNSTALFASVLFAANPAGIEALAWACAAGYVLTSTWMLTALLLFLPDRPNRAWAALGLTFIQALAFFTWDWGILILPVLLIIALVAKPLKELITLVPATVCWIIGAFLRLTSHFETSWQENPLLTKIKFLVGSPLLGLFPNMSKAFYVSISGIILALCLLAFLAWVSRQNRKMLALFLGYFISSTPWVLGGNPSGRYFYVSMVFLYLPLAYGVDLLKTKRVIMWMANCLLIMVIWFTYERATLWHQAFQQAEAFKQEVGALPDEKVVIINVPDAYGPETLSMRPQMWFSGLTTLFPHVKIAKTHGCPFVWRGVHRLEWVATHFPAYPTYEVVLEEGVFQIKRVMLDDAC